MKNQTSQSNAEKLHAINQDLNIEKENKKALQQEIEIKNEEDAKSNYMEFAKNNARSTADWAIGLKGFKDEIQKISAPKPKELNVVEKYVADFIGVQASSIFQIKDIIKFGQNAKNLVDTIKSAPSKKIDEAMRLAGGQDINQGKKKEKGIVDKVKEKVGDAIFDAKEDRTTDQNAIKYQADKVTNAALGIMEDVRLSPNAVKGGAIGTSSASLAAQIISGANIVGASLNVGASIIKAYSEIKKDKSYIQDIKRGHERKSILQGIEHELELQENLKNSLAFNSLNKEQKENVQKAFEVNGIGIQKQRQTVPAGRATTFTAKLMSNMPTILASGIVISVSIIAALAVPGIGAFAVAAVGLDAVRQGINELYIKPQTQKIRENQITELNQLTDLSLAMHGLKREVYTEKEMEIAKKNAKEAQKDLENKIPKLDKQIKETKEKIKILNDPLNPNRKFEKASQDAYTKREKLEKKINKDAEKKAKKIIKEVNKLEEK
ncbi:MAG: hypothetical protein O3C05_02260, partial [Proteobacteria bacterium]|nr:hypothetical protein [Pseudomonadota bacterium]